MRAEFAHEQAQTHLRQRSPARSKAIGTLSVAAMDQEEIGNHIAHLVQRQPDILGICARILGALEALTTTGKKDWSSFWDQGVTPVLSACAEEVAGIDYGRGKVVRMARARARNRLPRGTGLVAIECCRSFAHLLEGQHAGFGSLCAFDLLFQIARMHFGAIGRREENPDLVASPVKLSRLAAGCTVEEIDHAPGNILGIGLQGRVGKHREEVGPYPMRRNAALSVFSLIGRLELRADGKTYPSRPSISARSVR